MYEHTLVQIRVCTGGDALKRWFLIIQVAFTYIGTIVGAGFATGQEILQFFTIYGRYGSMTIVLSALLFIWLGTKMMLAAQTIHATSFEDLNRDLFGRRVGTWISIFFMFILFGISSVMLAGAGSVFHEHFHFPYQFGLFFTLLLSFVILSKGITAIFAVNSIVVPFMLVYIVIVVLQEWNSPSSDNWLLLDSNANLGRIWLSPILYAAFNLVLAQAVLVPIGGKIKDRSIIKMGGIIGGIGVGIMLLSLHFALSSKMPEITEFQIPMGHMATSVQRSIQLLFVGIIFCEIFTTFIADVYGLITQLERKIHLPKIALLIILLVGCYGISQFGFSSLVSTLYPLFGIISSAWMAALMVSKYKPKLD